MFIDQLWYCNSTKCCISSILQFSQLHRKYYTVYKAFNLYIIVFSLITQVHHILKSIWKKSMNWWPTKLTNQECIWTSIFLINRRNYLIWKRFFSFFYKIQPRWQWNIQRQQNNLKRNKQCSKMMTTMASKFITGNMLQ